ncbi:MAG: DUF3990 domain-containing protein [Clostridiales bacterium]|nr:DUF3990 domain-containing protein [Clostridiales bacterium]
METVTLYHGSPNQTLFPTFGLGEEKHDYGKGLYLTPNIELAREWAVCNGTDGFLYKIELNLSGLVLLNFDECDPLAWIAELMSHRDADTSIRYKRFAPKFIEKHKINVSHYDIIKGWRADSSYFLIAKKFVRDELDAALLQEALKLGDLGIQYCIKSSRAFEKIHHPFEPIEEVRKELYLERYNTRDSKARKNLYELMNSEKNTLTDTFSRYI